jgi:DNA-binding transcriptional MocR family regulator
VGDRIAVEDPGYVGCLDLTRAMGLTPVPVAVDDEGLRPEALAEVLDRGVQAVLLVPRAQNPMGAAVSAERAATLRTLLAGHPDVLVVEDDHTAAVAGPELHPVAARDRERWAVVRSVAKGLGPDLRTAVLAADADTVTRVLGRQRLGAGWVSHLLQRVTVELWTSAVEQGTLATAAAVYAERREAVLEAFEARGLRAHGASGLNVWLPVEEEVPVVQGLLSRGWAVQAGEPFRLDSAPGIRITIARLPVERAAAFASEVVDVLDRRLGTRRG